MDVTSPEFLGYLNQMLNGAVVTIKLFLSGFVLAFVFGTIIGIITLSHAGGLPLASLAIPPKATGTAVITATVGGVTATKSLPVTC